MKIDYTIMNDAMLDAAYESAFKASDTATAGVIEGEIIRRHFRWGDIFTFNFFAKYFPKYDAHPITLIGALRIEKQLIAQPAQAVGNAIANTFGYAKYAAIGAAVLVVLVVYSRATK